MKDYDKLLQALRDYQRGNLTEEECRDVCREYLILKGSINHNAVAILKHYGYTVGPGEQDSFGWLTAIIRKDGNRVIVFG